MVKRIVDEIKQMKIAIFIILAYMLLANYFFGYMCPSMVVVGLPCPGCGLTRAAISLAFLDFSSALHFNPMIFFALPLGGAYVFIYLKNGDLKKLFYPTAVIIIIAFIVFFLRIIGEFGTDPLLINRNALIFRLISRD